MKVKDLQVAQWVCIYLERYPIRADASTDWHEREVVKWYDMPRSMWDINITKKRIKWILARYNYLNPKWDYRNSFCFYDKRTGADWGIQSELSSISAAKGQVTKWKNKINKWVENWSPTLLISRVEDDPQYIAAMKKLNDKISKLNQMQEAFAEKHKDGIQTNKISEKA